MINEIKDDLPIDLTQIMLPGFPAIVYCDDTYFAIGDVGRGHGTISIEIEGQRGINYGRNDGS